MRHSRNDRQRVISKKVLRTQIPNRKTRFGKRHMEIWYAWQVQPGDLQEISSLWKICENYARRSLGFLLEVKSGWYLRLEDTNTSTHGRKYWCQSILDYVCSWWPSHMLGRTSLPHFDNCYDPESERMCVCSTASTRVCTNPEVTNFSTPLGDSTKSTLSC